MRPRGRSLLLLLSATVSCGGATRPLLHERPWFEGTADVELRERGHVYEVHGDLVFDRDSGHVQLSWEREGRTVTLVRLPAGDVRQFEDGAPQPIATDEEALFEALLRAIDAAPPAKATLERLPDGERIVQGETTLTVRLQPAQAHHGGP